MCVIALWWRADYMIVLINAHNITQVYFKTNVRWPYDFLLCKTRTWNCGPLQMPPSLKTLGAFMTQLGLHEKWSRTYLMKTRGKIQKK